MPCIQTKVSVPIAKDMELILKEQFGKAIALIPGKSEGWLMCTFEGNASVYYQGIDGDEQAAAWVQVSLYGKSEADAYSQLTGEICRILEEELAIPPARVFVKYDECVHWGWNGRNF